MQTTWPQKMRPGPSPTVSAPDSYCFRLLATVEDGCRFTSGPITSDKCGMPLGLAGNLCTEECKRPFGHYSMPEISRHWLMDFCVYQILTNSELEKKSLGAQMVTKIYVSLLNRSHDVCRVELACLFPEPKFQPD